MRVFGIASGNDIEEALLQAGDKVPADGVRAEGRGPGGLPFLSLGRRYCSLSRSATVASEEAPLLPLWSYLRPLPPSPLRRTKTAFPYLCP